MKRGTNKRVFRPISKPINENKPKTWKKRNIVRKYCRYRKK